MEKRTSDQAGRRGEAEADGQGRGLSAATGRDGAGAGQGPDRDGVGAEVIGHQAFSVRNLRTFASLKYPVFRIFYAGMIGQMGAMNMQMFVRALLVFRLTESPGAVGTMALANAVPVLFFSLFGGVIAERVQKKNILVVGQAASALVTGATVAALVTGLLHPGTWWLLVVFALAQGIIMGLMMPARQAIIAEIVPAGQLMNAVALNTFGMNGLRLTAPAVAGFLVDYFGTGAGTSGFAAVYIAMTGLYVMATAFSMALPRTGVVNLQGQGAMADILDGFRYVKQDRTILMVLLTLLVITMCSMSYMFLLPVFTETVLFVGPTALGVLYSASGAGAMAGSLVLASLPNKKRGLMLILGGLILGVALVAFSFSTVYYLSLVTIIFVGVGQTMRMTLGNTLLQYYVQDRYRGRVMSMMMMEFGMTSFVVAFVGLLAEFIGIQWAVGGFAIALIVFSLGALALMPRLRRLD